jgi:hypothetical protein
MGGYQGRQVGGYRGNVGGAYHEGGYSRYSGSSGGVYRGAGAYREGGYSGYGVGGVAREVVPTRGGMNQFLGLPTDAGLHAAGRGVVAVSPQGGIYAGHGVHYVSPSAYRSQAIAVRNNFYGPNLFTSGWYGRYPYAWNTAGLISSVWVPATWGGLGTWCGLNALPDYYDYGNTITYQGDTVYVQDQPTTTATQYYDQASALAGSSSPATQATDSQWMPLGVFALSQGNQGDSSMVIQLAINKAGILGGNYYNEISDTTLPIHGAMDKKTQRVAWTVGNNKNVVFDTGLYNLTKDEAPVLVHLSKDKTNQWLMVRVKQGNQSDNKP